MSRPEIEIWLEVEPSCNLRCQFCYNWWRGEPLRAPKRLDTDVLLSGLRRLLEAVRCTKVTLSGGEPLLRSDFDSIVEFWAERDIPIVLATNGTRLSFSRIKHLKSLGVRTFQVPLHSVSQKVHDALSGGVSWQSTIEAIVDAREAGAHAVLVFVASRVNLLDFPKVVALGGALGLKVIIFNRLVPSGLAIPNQAQLGMPTDEELIDILAEADAVAYQNGIAIQLGVPIALGPEPRSRFRSIAPAACTVAEGQKKWTIGVDGDIRRCSHSPQSIGTILDEGMDRLVAELAKRVPTASLGQQCCQIIDSSLVQIAGNKQVGSRSGAAPPLACSAPRLGSP